MNRRAKSGFKLISDDQLALNHATELRAIKRIVVSALLMLVAICLFIAANIPFALNKMTPVFWVHEANFNGLTEQLYDVILRLLASGRIEVMPPSFAWIMCISSGVTAWFSIMIFRNRKQGLWMGTGFTKTYWTSFYAFKEPVTIHRVKSRRIKKAP